MALPRLQLFEIEDAPWCPSVVRDLATDYLRFVAEVVGVERTLLPLVREALMGSGADRIVDLGSGGGGALLAVQRALSAEGASTPVVLTDLYPNRRALARACRDGPGALTYHDEPVDARRVPPGLSGLRTLFNAFHHFPPVEAAEILADAVRARQPIAVFELPQRSFAALPAMLLMPILVWAATPFIRPRTLRRLVWTYLLPAVPLLCWWDGLVSHLRAYRPAELSALAETATDGSYRWSSGERRMAGVPGRVTYLMGWPRLSPPGPGG